MKLLDPVPGLPGVAVFHCNGIRPLEVVEAAGPPARYDGFMKLPQLHLRDLFWLVALVACLCAWWVDHWKSDEVRQEYQGRYAHLMEMMDDLTQKLESEGVAWHINDKKGMFVFSLTDDPLPADALASRTNPSNTKLPPKTTVPPRPRFDDPFGGE